MDKDYSSATGLPLDESSAYELIRRADLWSSLLRRQEEESIARLVPYDSELIAQKKKDFIGERSLVDVLEELHWNLSPSGV